MGSLRKGEGPFSSIRMKIEETSQPADLPSALTELRDEVLGMSTLAQQSLDQAIRALMERSLELCKQVIKSDRMVDEAECRIDRMGMDAIVRFSPRGEDLRFILASMKISANLERISDHSVGIARRSKRILRGMELPEITFADLLYTKAAELLRAATTAYVDGNVELGASLTEQDKGLDRSYKRFFATLGQRVSEEQAKSDFYLHLILVLRSLERIGDLAVNIGENAVFIKAAKDIRHGRSLEDPPVAGPPA